MEQAASKNREMSSFNKRKGQTTYKVNVFFAENTTATFEDKLLHLVVNDIANHRLYVAYINFIAFSSFPFYYR